VLAPPFDWIATFCVGFAATFVFVTTGGVGMITIPALVFLGLSPQAAVATDIFALLGGRLGGLVALRQAGKVDIGVGLRLGVFTGLGAIGGAYSLLAIPAPLMKRLLGAFLLLMVVLLLKKPDVGVAHAGAVSTRRQWIGTLLFVPVGFWGTLVGAGFLNLGGMVLLLLLRRTFLETAGILTVVGLAVALPGVAVFASHGAIVWPLGLAMLAGKSAGGYLGARYAVGVGESRVRLLFMGVVLVSAVRLWW